MNFAKRLGARGSGGYWPGHREPRDTIGGTVIRIGDVVAGKYQVERLLGKGGMGYVVAARHAQLDQRFAIKILIPELIDSDKAVARFLREARASARIQSEHV